MPVKSSMEHTFADNVLFVHLFHLFLGHSLWNIYPKRIFGNGMYKIFSMEINSISLKLKPEKANNTNAFFVIFQWVRNEFNDARIFAFNC